MANPPITIGPFTNVPAPGSPIKSDWPQQITTYLYNRVPFAAAVGADVVIGPDASFVTVPLTTIHRNIGNAYNGTYWSAPAAGLVRVTWACNIAAGNSAGAADAIADYNANLAVNVNAVPIYLASANARFGALTLSGSAIVPVGVGTNIYPQVWINAPGKNKTVKAGVGSFTVEWIA